MINRYVYLKVWCIKYIKDKKDDFPLMPYDISKCYPNRGFSARRWKVTWDGKRYLLANRAIAKRKYYRRNKQWK